MDGLQDPERPSVVRELRCPLGSRRMFARWLFSGDPAPVVTPGSLIEFHCRDCTQAARAADGEVLRVLHRYDLGGTLVESTVAYRD